MKKFLTLLFLVSIFSYSLCTECTEDICGSFNKDGEQSHYVCDSSSTAEGGCDWILSCNYVVKEGDDTSFSCSDQPVSNKDVFTCVEDNNNPDRECKEISLCEAAQKTAGGNSESYQCSVKAVSDSDKFACIDDTSDSTNACMEIPF